MKRTHWLWLAGSLATAVGCSDPPPTSNPPPADVVSEKTPDATDNDVVGQDMTPPPDRTPPPDMTPPPDVDLPDGTPPPDVDLPDGGCSNAGETRCGDTCVNTMTNSANCGTCGTACTGMQVCMGGMCRDPMMCPMGQNLCGATCVNTQTDVANCGSCGNLCPSGQMCTGGTCMAPMMCPTGQTSCAGTCVDTQADSNNCGTCGTVCMMGQSCQAGMCRATTMCTAPQTACGGTCVNTMTDVANCGACGVACPTGQACTAGVCAMMGCTAPQVLCGTACANTQTDTANCGMCARACATGQMCVAGVCTGGVMCPTGQVACGAACADLQTDPTNCGMCGMACPAGNSCRAGACVAPRPTCMTGETDCAPMAPTPTCINTQTSNANCGACAVACPTGQTCVMGGCACATGQTLCGRTCVNTMTDTANCGACGRACPMGQSCMGAACVCPTGQTLCGGACVNAQTDNNNCGMCGRVCPSGQTCTAGACACPTGQTGCGTPPVCINTMTDRANCGACGRACTVMGQTCTGGTCACPTGQTACGTGAAAACINLQTSGTNCGMCGRVCAVGTACTAGVCMGTPPANDTRMGATVISLAMPSQTLAANTTAARNDTTACACTSGNDVFFRFTLTQPEVVYVDTFGATWDTSLFFQNALAQNGMALNSNVTATAPNVTCNDDNGAAGFCPSLGLQSQIAARLPAGSYYLVLSGCGSGTADIHFQHLPAGNGATNTRLTPSATEQTVAGTTAGTGAVGSTCCSGGPDNTHWWITCPSTAAQTFFASSCSAAAGTNLANYDLEIAQYSALRAAGAVCNDDTGFLCGVGSTLNSSIPATTAVQGGLNTLIADSCTSAGGNYTVRYVLAAPCVTGARCGATCVDTNTDVTNCGGCSRRCATGQTCAAGVCVSGPPNDLPTGAVVINMAVPQSIYTGVDTRSAVNNTTGSCGCTSGRDIFYNFTVPAGPRQIIYADTLGSNWDTSVFVQTSAGVNVTVPGLPTNGVACNDDNGLAGCGTGLQSQIMLLLNPGAYRLVVSGCGNGGTTTNLRFQHLPVGNGAVAAIAAGNTTPGGTTSGTGVIAQACGGGASGPDNTYYWHTCAAQAAGSFTASTCARATWDTVLEQRSASRAANVCNDDVGGTCGFRSSVTAAIPAGPGLHTFYVDGFSGGAGAYTVAVTRP